MHQRFQEQQLGFRKVIVHQQYCFHLEIQAIDKVNHKNKDASSWWFFFTKLLGCPYVKEGRKAFREFIDVLKTWVFSECGENYEFSQLKCGCVLEGIDL